MMNFISSSIPNTLSLSIKIMACTKVVDRLSTNGTSKDEVYDSERFTIFPFASLSLKRGYGRPT